MASRWAISASEARYSRIGPMAANSTPSNSPSALLSSSQRRAARSEPGHAMRAMIEPMAAPRIEGAHSEGVEQGAEPELVHRPQTQALHADRARANQLQGVDVEGLEVAPAPCRGVGAADALVCEQCGGDALGV